MTLSTPKAVVFQNDRYSVRTQTVDPSRPVVVTFSPRNRKNAHRDADGFSMAFGSDAVLSLGLNVIEVVSAHNDWYKHPSIAQAVRAAKAGAENRPIITYGSSMGGHAAIALSGALQASAYVSISPQFSIQTRWLQSIKDPRWADEARENDAHPEHMTSSQNRERHGLIFYDGQHPLDKAHVRACAEVTKAVTVSIPYAGHPVGETLNRSYKLKKLLAEVAALVERGDHPSSAAWASYAAEVAAAHHCSDIHTFNTSTDFETMAHHYSLGRPFRVSIDAAEHFFSKLHRASYPICGVLLGMQILSENTGSLKRNPARLKRIASEFETGLHRRGYRIPVGLQKQLDNVSAGKPI